MEEDSDTRVLHEICNEDSFITSSKHLNYGNSLGWIITNRGAKLKPVEKYYFETDIIRGDTKNLGTFVREEKSYTNIFYYNPGTPMILLGVPKVVWRIGETKLEGFLRDKLSGGLYYRYEAEDRNLSDLNAKKYGPVDVAVRELDEDQRVDVVALIIQIKFKTKL